MEYRTPEYDRNDLREMLKHVQQSRTYFNYYLDKNERETAVTEISTLCGTFYEMFRTLLKDYTCPVDHIRYVGNRTYDKLIERISQDLGYSVLKEEHNTSQMAAGCPGSIQ